MENAYQGKNDFTKGSMSRTILGMAIPMTLAQLVSVLYNVVDRMYIGHIPGVGSMALTGLGLCMPVIAIITAFTSLVSKGGAPLCSIERGRGNTEEAERIMANCLTMLLVFAAVLTVGFLFFAKPILYLFGASDETYPYAAAYSDIYILGTVFAMVSTGMNAFINSQGFARTGMLTVLFGAVLNIILDPVFIFVFDMGIRGAAIATVISQAGASIWALGFLFSKRPPLRFRLSHMLPSARRIGKICALGVTGFMMSATNGLVQILCNKQLQLYGGDLYVGVMTVINSVREVSFMIVDGMVSGAQPVLGFNYGARVYTRVRAGIRFMTRYCLCYTALMWTFLMLLPRLPILIFNNEPALVEAAVPALRIYFSMLVVMSLQMIGQSTFVALGRARSAIFFSTLRKVIIVVPLVIFLPRIAGLGVTGVFLSEPISDVISATACYLTMYLTVYRPLGAAPDGEPLKQSAR